MVGGFNTRSFLVVGNSDWVEKTSALVTRMGGRVVTTYDRRPDIVVCQREVFLTLLERQAPDSAALKECVGHGVPVVDDRWLQLCDDEGFFNQPSRDLRLDIEITDRSAYLSPTGSGVFDQASHPAQPQQQQHVDPAAGVFALTRPSPPSQASSAAYGVPTYEASPGQYQPPPQVAAPFFASTPPRKPQPAPATQFSVPVYEQSPGQKVKTPPADSPYGAPAAEQPMPSVTEAVQTFFGTSAATPPSASAASPTPPATMSFAQPALPTAQAQVSANPTPSPQQQQQQQVQTTFRFGVPPAVPFGPPSEQDLLQGGIMVFPTAPLPRPPVGLAAASPITQPFIQGMNITLINTSESGADALHPAKFLAPQKVKPKKVKAAKAAAHHVDPSTSQGLDLVIKTLTGKSIKIVAQPDWTTSSLKEAVLAKEGIPADQQRLIFTGKQLDDDRLLSQYHLTSGSIIHLVLRLRVTPSDAARGVAPTGAPFGTASAQPFGSTAPPPTAGGSMFGVKAAPQKVPAQKVRASQVAKAAMPAPKAPSRRKSAKKPAVISPASPLPSSPLGAPLETWDKDTPLHCLQYGSDGRCNNPYWTADKGSPVGPAKGGYKGTSAVPVNSDEENIFIDRQDADLRQLYLNDRDSPQLDDPYVSLVDVYSNEHLTSFMRSNLTAAEHMIPRVLQQWTKFPPAAVPQPSVASYQEFRTQFDTFTQNQLDGLDWSNVFLAGGCILACLMRQDEVTNGFRGSDIDLFLYGLSDEEGEEKIKHIFQTVARNREKKGAAQAPELVRTPHAVTIVGDHPFRHIQIVLRMYKNPAEVIIGFDIDSCSVGFDGDRAFTTLRARRSLNKRINLVSMSRRSTTYEVRLHKYSKRGFAVAVPQLQLDQVLRSVFTGLLKGKEGLQKLLFLDEQERRAVIKWKEENPNGFPDGARSDSAGIGVGSPFIQRGRGRTLPAAVRGGRALRGVARRVPTDRVSRRFERLRAKTERKRCRRDARGYDFTGRPGRPKPADWTEKSDYHALLLPWGPAWHNWNLTLFLVRKDKAQLFSGKEHKHVAVCGLESVLTGKAHWCRMCRDGVPTNDDGALNSQYVTGRLRWFRKNPGTQLLTGSFHPVSDDMYETGVYSVPGARSTDVAQPPVHVRAFGPAFASVLPGTMPTQAAVPSATAAPVKAPAAIGSRQQLRTGQLEDRKSAAQGTSASRVLSFTATASLLSAATASFKDAQYLSSRRSLIYVELQAVVTVASGSKFPTHPGDWKWSDPAVPTKLKNLESDSGAAVVIVANITAISDRLIGSTPVEAELNLIATDLGVPLAVLVAPGPGYHQMPSIGFHTFIRRQHGKAIGDAMNNVEVVGRCSQEALSCYAFGKNVEKNGARVTVHGVSDFLQDGGNSLTLKHPGDDVRAMVNSGPSVGRLRDLESLLETSPSQPEVVVLMGPPVSGKTTLAQRHFVPRGYAYLTQSANQTPEVLAEATTELLLSGCNVVIDGGNPTTERRALFRSAAEEAGATARLVVLATPTPILYHLNFVRMVRSFGATLCVPASGFTLYETALQKPKSSERFSGVVEVPFQVEFLNEMEKTTFQMISVPPTGTTIF